MWYVCVGGGVHEKLEGNWGVGSLLLPLCGLGGSSSGCQAYASSALPTEPYSQLKRLFGFLKIQYFKIY